MDTVSKFDKALQIISKYAPDAVLIVEEQYYLVNIGKKIIPDADVQALKRLGWNYEENQVYKMR